jgi:RimJ/RimL family protein N-acetyltransferase
VRVDRNFRPILTDRLRLRRSVPGDAEAISSYRSDPVVRRFQGWERTDPQHVRQEIEGMQRRPVGGSGGWVQFSVEERIGGRLIGDVGLSPVEEEPDVVKIGYTVAPAAQGLGYATEAVAALVDYAFGRLGAGVVRAYASEENLASIRVAEKVGMRLVERIERSSGERRFIVVRYELPRPAG